MGTESTDLMGLVTFRCHPGRMWPFRVVVPSGLPLREAVLRLRTVDAWVCFGRILPFPCSGVTF
jgi:hypothetical protein